MPVGGVANTAVIAARFTLKERVDRRQVAATVGALSCRDRQKPPNSVGKSRFAESPCEPICAAFPAAYPHATHATGTALSSVDPAYSLQPSS